MTYAQAATKLRMAQHSIALLMPLEWLRLNMKDGSEYMTAVDMAANAAEQISERWGEWNTEDAVPVVRCKDCRWWKLSEYNTTGIHVCKMFNGVLGENDFCSRGEANGGDE